MVPCVILQCYCLPIPLSLLKYNIEVHFTRRYFCSDKYLLEVAIELSFSRCSAPLGQSTGTSSSGRQSSFSSSGTVSNVILGQSTVFSLFSERRFFNEFIKILGCFTTQRVGRRIMNLLGALKRETPTMKKLVFLHLHSSY
jgi:hypothetical protein